MLTSKLLTKEDLLPMKAHWKVSLINLIDKQFSCDKCGSCCKIPHPIFLTVFDIGRLAHHFDKPFDKIYKKYVKKINVKGKEQYRFKKDRPCKFLKSNRCSIYKHRPQACRAYPLGSNIFQDNLEIKDVRFADWCPQCQKLKRALTDNREVYFTNDDIQNTTFADVKPMLERMELIYTEVDK